MAGGKYTETDPVKIDLKTVCDYFYKEDISTRQAQVRFWKRLKYYWNNFSQVFWSEKAGSYLVNGRDNLGDGEVSDDQSYYDRPVNVFKAFLETIIAALSVNIPAISCAPDDADNPNDIATAKAGNKISELLYKHNNAIFLWLQMLYIYCTEGLIAVYIYTDSDEKYGTYQKAHHRDEPVTDYFCPSCKQQLDEEMVIQAKLIEQQLKDKYDPNDDDDELAEYEDDKPIRLNEQELIEPVVCPSCALMLDPNLQKTTLMIPRFIGNKSTPKSRICMEVFGGLYVKVANYARKQADTPYLIWMFETHYVNVLQTYPDLWDKIERSGFTTQGSDPIEEYARLNIQYRGTMPEDNVSVKTYWLRPAAFNKLETKQKADAMKRKYPNGCKVVVVNDVIAEYCSESLDDHWTLSHNPTSDYLNHEPLGEVLVNIQDIINDLISLTLQIIEHGIPENWVDPGVVAVDAINQREVIPGAYTPTKQVSASKNISEAFYSTKAASLAPEIFNFYKIVQELGQFVSGALPSIFGGVQAGGSNTASEYAMSKGMALQRLQTPWKMLTILWKTVFGKAIPAYMKLVSESGDEKFVKKNEQGNFVNTFIKKAELAGKIGSVELEAADQLPITDEQQKDIILQLMQLNNAEVFEALTSSENLPFVRKIVRIPQFRMPGEDDRQKQLEEINELINSVPIPDGMGGFTSSIPIDPILDNSRVEAEICRNWLVGDEGRLAKVENLPGYTNVLLHFQEHTNELNRQAQVMQMTNAAAAESQQKQTGKDQKPSGAKGKGPEKIKDTSNVSTPVS